MRPKNQNCPERVYYFFCCIEGDLLIHAGISQIIKKIDPFLKTTILFPKHSRIENKVEKYKIFFDEVIHLPFCHFDTNLFKGIKRANYFKDVLNNISFQDRSIFFMFDVYEFVELLFYHRVQELRKTKRCKLAIVSAFDAGEALPDKRSLVIGGTVFKSFYSLLYGQKMFYEYKTKKTSMSGIHYYDTVCDANLALGNSWAHSDSKQNIKNLLYPPIMLQDDIKGLYFNTKDINAGKFFLVLVDTEIISHQIKDYWKKMKILTEYLSSHYPYKIVVKDHPGMISDAATHLKNKNILIFDMHVNAEELYLNAKENIIAVLGYGSTALLTASYFGITAVNISEYLGFDENIIKRFKIFMKLSGNEIIEIKNLDDLISIDFNRSSGRTSSQKDVLNSWGPVLTALSDD